MERARAAWEAMNNHMDALVAPVEVEYSRWMHATQILQRYYKYLLIRCFITQALPHAHKMIRSILFMYPPPLTTHLLPPPKVLAHCYFDSQPHSQPPPLACSWPLTECGNELLSLGYIKGRPWNTWGSIPLRCSYFTWTDNLHVKAPPLSLLHTV